MVINNVQRRANIHSDIPLHTIMLLPRTLPLACKLTDGVALSSIGKAGQG